MLPLPDDSRLTPDQRRREIASILARGILRLHRMARPARGCVDSSPSEDAPEPAPKGLELSATSRPHVTHGRRNRDRERREKHA